MKLVWSRHALEDRRGIHTYIEADDPRAAADVDENRGRHQAPRRLPESGRPGRVIGTRELLIARTSYIAPYILAGDTVRILRVIHGARIWPDAIADD